METPGPLRTRARRRNVRAVVVSCTLIGLAVLCVVMLLGAHGGGHGRATTVRVRAAKVRVVTTTKATAAPTTTTSVTVATTTTSSSPSTSTSTTTRPRPVAVPPPPPTPVPTAAPAPTTSTTYVRASAGASVADTPQWCTVTVWLSTGAHQGYDVGKYVKNRGDTYTFTATLGGFRVDVTTKVVDQDGKPVCQASLANLVRT